MSDPHAGRALAPEAVRDAMRAWVDRAVIGLNLCPFAKAVQVKGLVHYAVSQADDETALMRDLDEELRALAAMPAEQRDTTLLMAPRLFEEFIGFHDFIARAERRLRKLGLEGDLQIATFHPRFQFAGTEPDDITNYTNRAPYPTLHLLRESSIDRAVAAFPQAESIYEQNMRTLRDLGHAGWNALMARGPTGDCGKLER